ncbi:hypothetical protein UlMin_009813 [Ulmus minor]
MAGMAEEEMNYLLTTFDQIYEDFKNSAMEIQLLKSNSNGEIKNREALEIDCENLKQENERLTKLYAESLNNMVDQLEHRTSCQSLKEQVVRIRNECLSKEDEQKKAVESARESIKQDYAKKIGDMEARIRGFQLDKSTNEATVKQLRQDLEAHKSHIHYLATRLDRVQSNAGSRFEIEIQELKDRVAIEKKEKIELKKKVQELEKELSICKSAKLVEQQKFSSSALNLKTLKKNVAESVKENKILKRKLFHSGESSN